ncbi:MAG: hypothetical protein ABSE56_15235 [Bryobacteraceae bacterium]
MRPSGEYEARRRPGFSKGERRAGAADIERRTAWLAWPLVDWPGSFTHPPWPREIVYRPAACLIAEKLSRLPAERYAVRLEYNALNPTVPEIAAVSRPLIADTLSALGAARKYPKELPPRVGDLAAWRQKLEQRLKAISAEPAPGLALPKAIPDAAAAEYAWASGQPASLIPFYPLPRDAGRVFAGLVGRASAFADPPAAVAYALAWLSACAQVFRKKGAALETAVASLQSWLGETGWVRANVEALLESLAERGPELLAGAGSDWDAFVASSGILGRLEDLSADERRRLFTHRLFSEATHVARRGPAALHALFALPEKWLALNAEQDLPFLWPNLLKLTSRTLVRRLLDWLDTVPPEHAGQALRLLDDVLWGVTDVVAPKQAAVRQGLLERHPWICEELLASASRSRREWLLLFDVLRLREKHSGEARVRTLVRSVLSDPARFDWADFELSAELSPNDDEAFLRLLELSAKCEGPGDPSKGWKFLRAFPDARQFLSECAGSRYLAGRAWKILARLDLALRLQSRIAIEQWLSAWQAPAAGSGLSLVAAYRTLAGEPEPLPKTITALLGYSEARRRELETLRGLERSGALPMAAQPRLRRLEAQDAVVSARKVERACRKELGSAKLAALEAGLRQVISGHWERLGLPPNLDGPDWENALHLYAGLRANRRILKTLLAEEARGNRDWIRKHPANAAWIARMDAAGVNTAIWLGEREEIHEIEGAVWTVYLETNPLRVLQMGNLFSTCLSAGGSYAFSTVANAVEVNKRVLYIRDRSGAIVGRRLIALGGPKPTLIGFRPYGASPWVKIVSDQFCLRLANSIGAEVTADSDLLDAVSESLSLFAKWYNDGPHPFA